MPVWALVGIMGVVTAVAVTGAVLLVLMQAAAGHWPMGFTALMVGLVSLVVRVAGLVVVTGVLRSIDRRTR